MAKVPLNEVDIKSLINLALQSKMSWNQLGVFLTGLTPEESNQIIIVLLKELEALQSKLTVGRLENDIITQKDIDATVGEVETFELNIVDDIQCESVGPNSENNFFQEILHFSLQEMLHFSSRGFVMYVVAFHFLAI